MLVCDYIVEFLISKGVHDVFGYPGGMVTYFMDALDNYSDQINNHICYHEQAAAFAACGYAQASGKLGVCYATSGPGATNLMTGIANAYFDSIPMLAITGQVNIAEQKGSLHVRQKGFQEYDVCSAVKDITKYCLAVKNADEIPNILDKAYTEAFIGRKGPVVLDIPMNIFCSDIKLEDINRGFQPVQTKNNILADIDIFKLFFKAKKPIIVAGNGIHQSETEELFRCLVERLKIPVITSMISVDLLTDDSAYNFGFGGIYGNRSANIIISQCDLILVVGCRLDCRFVGSDVNAFAPNAKLIRVDIDYNELENKIHKDEIGINMELKYFFQFALEQLNKEKLNYDEWLKKAQFVKEKLRSNDFEEGNRVIAMLSEYIPENSIITTDVGQNQVWAAQSFVIKPDQRILFSGGHGSMGYSLPAAIGAYYGCEGKKSIVSLNGDGGIQMNIQELQTIASNRIPAKIIILNNSSLGMIRHFQELYFSSNYVLTTCGKGYSVPDFLAIAEAYKIKTMEIKTEHDLAKFSENLANDLPMVFLVEMSDCTYVFPKLVFGKPTYDQEPPLSEELLQELLAEMRL